MRGETERERQRERERERETKRHSLDDNATKAAIQMNGQEGQGDNRSCRKRGVFTYVENIGWETAESTATATKVVMIVVQLLDVRTRIISAPNQSINQSTLAKSI